MGTKKKRTLLNASGGMLAKLCLTIDMLPAQMRMVASSPMSFHGIGRLAEFTIFFLDKGLLGHVFEGRIGGSWAPVAIEYAE